jgi:hypothetical protein
MFSCDSFLTLTLTVIFPSYDTISQSICDGDTFTIGSKHYTASNTYTDTLTNVGGCDSIVTLHLTVKPLSYDTVSQSICSGDSFVFGSSTYRAQGYYSQILTGSNGCDSMVTLELMVNPQYIDTLADTVCGSYNFYGLTLTASGT